MKLYRTTEGRWAGTQADAGKGHTPVDVPVDKPNLLKWLNEHCTSPVDGSPGKPDLDELEQAELRAVNAGTTTPRYDSPLDARTVIAGIDAGMIAAAVAQFDGPNLARVVHAAILRMAELGRGLKAMGETQDGG